MPPPTTDAHEGDDDLQIISSTIKKPQATAKGKKARVSKDRPLVLENAHYKQMVLRLQAKHRKTREELKEARSTIEAKEREIDALRLVNARTLVERTTRMKEAMECGICLNIMWDSIGFVECGHSFCSTCVQAVVGERRFEIQEEQVLKKIRELIRNIRIHPSVLQTEDVPEIFHPSTFFKAPYSCPVCKKGVFIKPSKNYAMNAVMDSIRDFVTTLDAKTGSASDIDVDVTDGHLNLVLSRAAEAAGGPEF